MMLPVYGALHLIPTLVLRHQHVARSPLKMLLRVILGVTRSCSFLGVFVVIYQSTSPVPILGIVGKGNADQTSTLLLAGT